MLPIDQSFRHAGQTVAWGAIGDGPPVVMIHGFPWNAQAWRKIAPWLARTRRVYFFDMIGCGRSEKREGQIVSPAVQNDLLAALFSHWGFGAEGCDVPEVVAHDFGGLCALRGRFLNGLRYKRLTLIDAVGVLPSGSPFFAHVRHHEAAFAGLPDYAHAALFDAYVQSAAHRPMAPDALDLYRAPWTGPEGRPAFYRQIAQAGEPYIQEAMDRYDHPGCPTHVVWAREDAFIPLSQGEELASRLNADRMTVIDDAGHIIQEDAPEAVVGALLAGS